MAVLGPHPERASCPTCGSRNVLMVAATDAVASLYCLACEHLFAAGVGQTGKAARFRTERPGNTACKT